MRALITLLIPENVEEKIDPIKKKYDPKSFSKIHSHITLYPPFEFTKEREVLAESISDITRDHKPFKISIVGVGTFYEKVLFFSLSCPPELTKLYRDVSRAIPNPKKRRTEYIPHVTIIQKGREEYVRRCSDAIDKDKYEETFYVYGVRIYWWGDKKWELDKEIYFKKVKNK